MIKKISVLLIVGLCLATALNAQEAEKKKILSKETKQIEGEVSAINKDYIAIVYKRDKDAGIEYEMLLPIESTVVLQHKRSLNQIAVGDTVRVEYEETQEESDAGVKNNRKGKTIIFVKPADNKLVSGDESLDNEALPLKGTKNE